MDAMERMLAAVRKASRDNYDQKVGQFSLTYERKDLAGMGVNVPPLSLHDYSLTSTEIVIAAIETRLAKVRHMAVHHSWALPLPVDQYTVELEGALWAEQRHLRNEKMRDNMPRIFVEAAE